MREFSRRAVARLGDEQRVQPQVIVTHARMVLESTRDEKACLDVLAGVVDYEMEMGLVTRAEFYYLLAICYHGCGLAADARTYLVRAGDLPCSGSLKRRLLSFIGQLEENHPERQLVNR